MWICQRSLSPCEGTVAAAGFAVEKMSVRPNALSSTLVFCLLKCCSKKKKKKCSSNSQEGKPSSWKEKILRHKITTGRKVLEICHKGVK